MSDMMKNIKSLREISGAGFLDCKSALENNNNDIEKSLDYLRKKGLSKALKKSSREAKEGAVGVFFDEEKILLIEINTETDFAAKNEIFLDFLELISNFVLQNKDIKDKISPEEFMKLPYENKTVNDLFGEIVSKIGENIVLRKIDILQKKPDEYFFHYTHNTYRLNIGKISVALVAKANQIDDEIKTFGKNLCMHIAASKPLSYDINDLDKSIIDKEKEIQFETIKSSGKPKEILDKILEGKMKKFYSEVTFLNQNYILDNEKSIKKVIEECSNKNNFEIIDYSYFVLGN